MVFAGCAFGRDRADWIRRSAHDSFVEFKRLIADEALDVDTAARAA